jgi:choline-sulfatase
MRILYLDLDTLRPDHLGCYGYQRNTSPNIDRIAKNGIIFDNCYCSDAPCLPSRTALFTGRFGIHTGVVGHGGTAADLRIEGAKRSFTDTVRWHSLPSRLQQKARMKTVLVSPFAERHSAWHYYAGFDEMYNTGKGGNESADQVTPQALQWIDRFADQDGWYLHVNYWDPHKPYRTPSSFGNPFRNDPLPPWMTQEILECHLQCVGPHSANELNMWNDRTSAEFPRQPGRVSSMEDFRSVIDGYDTGIAYMDSHIGTLLNALADKKVLDDTVIIISADHAENLGELGIYAEHATADHITCRIPLIVRWPAYGGAGRSEKGLVYNLDLGPTICELLQIPPAESWDGKSYAPAITGKGSCGRDDLIVSQCAHVCQRGVRFGPWMYIRTYHDGYHLFPTEMLFNVETDPHEQYDVAVSHADVCRDALHRLCTWHDGMMQSSSSDIDPLWTVIREGGPHHARGKLKDYCGRLESTGRGWAVAELKRRHPQEW